MKTKILCAFLVLLAYLSLAAADQSYFVVLNNAADLREVSGRLEATGSKIHLRVPPRILTVSADSSPALTAGVERSYSGPVPVADIEAMGPMATAAALQWNRGLVKRTPQMGAKSAMAVRSLAAQSSLPSPEAPRLTAAGTRLRAEWNSVTGALLYQVHVSKTPDFKNIDHQTYTDEPTVVLPSLAGVQYVRVRAVEPLSSGLTGEWSNNASISMAVPDRPATDTAPVLTSPLNAAESDGFTVMLEWIADSGAFYRWQMAESSSFSNVLIDRIAEGGEGVVPAGVLQKGCAYYWRVMKHGPPHSLWSSVRSIKVGEPVHGHDAMINPEAPQ